MTNALKLTGLALAILIGIRVVGIGPLDHVLGLGGGVAGKLVWLSAVFAAGFAAARKPFRYPAWWRWLNADWRVAMLLSILAAVIGVMVLTELPDLPWIAPDTGTYLGFAVYRTLLYPVILRLLATVTDEPTLLVVPQLLAGLTVTVLFAEALQRLTRNAVASLAAGTLLLFCWPLQMRAAWLLADYPFYALLTGAMTLALAAISRPAVGRLVGLAAFTAAAMMLRPIGIAALAVVPVLVALAKGRRRLLATALILPLAAMLAGTVLINWRVLGYPGLENFSGFGTSANTLLLLEADTPTSAPDLRDELLHQSAPFRQSHREVRSVQERYRVVAESTDLLLGIALETTRQYGRRNGLIVATDPTPLREIVAATNRLSPLNRRIGAQVPLQDDWEWRWIDSRLAVLGASARLHNPAGLARLTLDNLRFLPGGVLPFARIGGERETPHGLRLERADLGLGGSAADTTLAADRPLAKLFNRIAGALVAIDQTLSFALLVILSLFATIILAISRWRAGLAIPTDMAAILALAAVAGTYYLAVCYGQIPLERLVVVCAAPAAALATIPLLLPRWISGLLNREDA